MNKRSAETFGWYGAGAILVAYGLSSFGMLSTHSVWYQLLNATGAAGIVVVSWKQRAYPPAVLNAVWLFIAIVALIRTF